MDVGVNLDLEQRQDLYMTPKLQLSIELLQFSSQDLYEYIEEKLESNPLLEKDKTQSKVAGSGVTKDSINYENFISEKPNLRKYLKQQLYLVLKDSEIEVGTYIIGSLDQAGFLDIDLEEISEKFNISQQKTKYILKRIQSLDPAGIAARNLEEALLIQLRSLSLDTKLAETIVSKYLKELKQKNYKKIIKKLDNDNNKIKGAINLIRTLNHRPGAAYGDEQNTSYIEPDLRIKQVKNKYVVIINEKASPLLKVNSYYYQLMQKSEKGELNDYLEDKFKSALWLIRSIEKRRVTIFRIAQAIKDKQKEFLKKGIKYVKPMTMQEIADDIDMHESTVSRATSDKYIQTPHGLYELKFFFASGINNYSSVSIKAMIKEIIENEDSGSPLSDSKIADRLKEEGLKLSRRTVAKYRSELGILSSSDRRVRY